MLPLALIAAVAAQPHLAVEGTEFVLSTGDGRTLRGTDLAGATLTLTLSGRPAEVTIASVEEDRDAVGGRVLLYRFLVKSAELCAADAEGRHLGFPLPDGRGGFELTCTSGAVGKCVRWGYRPWEGKPGGPPLRALHEACVHMARADYGGDGRPATREGKQIYVCDRFGVRPCADGAPLRFEAAWSAERATCVARTRVPESATLDQLRERYPALDGHLGPSACTMAAEPAAILFNRS
jgi:hypothetical protein